MLSPALLQMARGKNLRFFAIRNRSRAPSAAGRNGLLLLAPPGGDGLIGVNEIAISSGVVSGEVAQNEERRFIGTMTLPEVFVVAPLRIRAPPARTAVDGLVRQNARIGERSQIGSRSGGYAPPFSSAYQDKARTICFRLLRQAIRRARSVARPSGGIPAMKAKSTRQIQPNTIPAFLHPRSGKTAPRR